ncbi:MAG: hypothetical protein HY276_05175 [Ignavibacteriales bacterium]|nr:hypothetical protein [Ignavibacteriales bacterium]
MNTIQRFKTLKGLRTTLVIVMTLALLTITFISCDLVDPTKVTNPQITDESLVGQLGSLNAAVSGIRFTFAQQATNTAYFTDCVSDNYQNVATFISPNVDFPRSIRSDDLTLNGNGALYARGQQVRAQVKFALEQVAPKDPSPSGIPALIAEATFYRGMATLLLGENFSNIPLVEGGAVVSNNEVLDAAIADLNIALTSAGATTNIKTAAQFALARAYRQRGSKTQAVAAANAALAINNSYVFSVTFDAASNPTNTNQSWVFAVSRALNDIQPLPRLDFLDPKYTDPTGVSPMPLLKAEEMYLILAEAALSDNDLATAKARMKDAINLAKGNTSGRTAVNFLDKDPRTGRPNADNITVKADANAPAKAGLVKRRSSSTITVRPISDTSVLTSDVDALTTASNHLYTIYLLRQEIFFSEGRRMCDLGIRLPMMQRQIETNLGIAAGSAGTVPNVPAYIPANNDMDKFTTAGTVVTCNVDMNLVIATNKVSPFTMPF